MKRLLISAALAATFATTTANAAIIVPLVMNFQSGATFTGSVTLANDYSYALDVTGLLSGGPYGSVPITWVWSNGRNFSSGAYNYSTFLMDGPSPGGYVSAPYNYFIQFAYNYSAAPTLTYTTGVSSGGTDNYINYVDPLVSGSIGAVPEPQAWVMLIAGFGLVGAAARRRRTAVAA